MGVSHPLLACTSCPTSNSTLSKPATMIPKHLPSPKHHHLIHILNVVSHSPPIMSHHDRMLPISVITCRSWKINGLMKFLNFMDWHSGQELGASVQNQPHIFCFHVFHHIMTHHHGHIHLHMCSLVPHQKNRVSHNFVQANEFALHTKVGCKRAESASYLLPFHVFYHIMPYLTHPFVTKNTWHPSPIFPFATIHVHSLIDVTS